VELQLDNCQDGKDKP